MATIRKEVRIEARPETAWDALRDVGALHTRVAPGFVTDVRLEEGARIVTFGNGMVAREVIVSVEDDVRRLVWSIVGGRMTHHNGSAQVFADGPEGSRFVWTTDLLPDALAPSIEAMMAQTMPIIQATIARAERGRDPRPCAAGYGAPR
jgi:carbon monoxide dehydrogenase subunit G